MKWNDCLPKPGKGTLNPSRAELRHMEQENRTYPVDRLVDVPRATWPRHAVPASLVRVMRNRDFIVQVHDEPGHVVRLTIRRAAYDAKAQRWADGITWDDLQHLKTLAGYGGMTALEIYPPDDCRVDVAAMRHLWIVPAPPPFMWTRTRT